MTQDDSSVVMIDGVKVIEAPGNGSRFTGAVTLSSGWHDFYASNI
jgi:hypothetical protein